MNPCGAPWAAWITGEDMLSPLRTNSNYHHCSRLRTGNPDSFLRGLILLPLFKIGFRHDLERGPHLMVTQPAKLRAGNFIGADLVCLEMEWHLHARHDVLLQPELADEEIVNDITRPHDQQNRFTDWHLHRGA